MRSHFHGGRVGLKRQSGVHGGVHGRHYRHQLHTLLNTSSRRRRLGYNPAIMSIPTLSLIVAALAVFFGPLISLWIAKRQIASSAEVANKQIIAPMRQAWINNLRDLVAELTGDTLHYFTAGHEFEGYKNFQRLTFLESKIQLMLNPNEEDHQKLEEMMKALRRLQSGDEQGRDQFIATHPEVMKLARKVLKREWNRVKDKIEVP